VGLVQSIVTATVLIVAFVPETAPVLIVRPAGTLSGMATGVARKLKVWALAAEAAMPDRTIRARVFMGLSKKNEIPRLLTAAD
jgi:hypothetical protein